MAVTKKQEMFINILWAVGLSKDTAIGIVLMLQKEEQMDLMVDFIEDNPKATESELLMKAVELSGGPKEFTIED